eukprot:50592-Chlamydomonas_euryale.AAC.4
MTTDSGSRNVCGVGGKLLVSFVSHRHAQLGSAPRFLSRQGMPDVLVGKGCQICSSGNEARANGCVTPVVLRATQMHAGLQGVLFLRMQHSCSPTCRCCKDPALYIEPRLLY